VEGITVRGEGVPVVVGTGVEEEGSVVAAATGVAGGGVVDAVEEGSLVWGVLASVAASASGATLSDAPNAIEMAPTFARDELMVILFLGCTQGGSLQFHSLHSKRMIHPDSVLTVQLR